MSDEADIDFDDPDPLGRQREHDYRIGFRKLMATQPEQPKDIEPTDFLAKAIDKIKKILDPKGWEKGREERVRIEAAKLPKPFAHWYRVLSHEKHQLPYKWTPEKEILLRQAKHLMDKEYWAKSVEQDPISDRERTALKYYGLPTAEEIAAMPARNPTTERIKMVAREFEEEKRDEPTRDDSHGYWEKIEANSRWSKYKETNKPVPINSVPPDAYEGDAFYDLKRDMF